MRKIVLLPFLYCALSVISSTDAYAHSGGLNSSGCHGGSRPYHCHRSSSEMVKSSTGHNRLSCSAGSQSIDCKGSSSSTGRKRGSVSAPHSGISDNSIDIYTLQRNLKRHCSGLDFGFIDGTYGKITADVIRVFQISYGLEPDGIIGPNTMGALQGEVRNSCSISTGGYLEN